MSKNFFAALDYEDDDDEDNDTKKVAAAAPKKEVVTVDVTAGTTVKTTTTSKPKPAKPVGSAPANTRAPAKSQPRGAAPAGEGAPAGVLEPVAHDDRRRPNNNDRHTKFGRGGSNNNTYSRDKRHTYDRRSGTGRGREVRKDGAGPHNWGSDQNEARQAEGPVSEETVNAVPAADDERVEGEGAAAATGEEVTGGEEAPVEEEEEPAPVEEEDNTMTYEEYLASRQLLQDNAAFAPVKERELTADEFAGLKLKPKTKEEEADFFAGSAGKTKRTRVKKEKQALVPAFRVASGPEEAPRQRREGGRGGRGGRGGFEPREGGGRGSYEPREGGGRGGYEPREGGGRGGYDVSRGGGYDGGRGGGGGFEGGRGDGEGRGGRGRGRGGRGRGGFRGGGDRGGFGGRGGRYREKTTEINVADPESFPAL